MKDYSKEELELLRHNTTTVVHTLIVMWLKIRQELSKHNRSKALRIVIQGNYKNTDEKLSRDFFEKFKHDKIDGKHIIWNKSYYDYYSSVMLYIENNDISFGFPFQCRQWPQSKLIDRIITEILRDVSVFNLEKFLILWTKLRLQTTVKLAGSDITIISYLTKKRKLEHYMKAEHERIIAKNCGMSNTNVSYRMRRLTTANIYFNSIICNLAKIGFSSVITTNTRASEFDKFSLVRLRFPKFNLLIYQIPHEWIQNEESAIIIENLEFGYSTGCLRPEGNTNHKIERSYADKVLSASYHKFPINLISESQVKNEKELEVLGFFSPMGYQLTTRVSDLANQFQISETSIRAILKRLLENNFIYNFIDLNFLGFYKYIGIFVKGKTDNIEKLTQYLRQYFHYRFYTNSNFAFIHLRISSKQYNQLLEEAKIIRNDFEIFELCIFENNKHTYVKRSIDFKNASWTFDNFMGLKWESKNLNLEENIF